MRLALKIVLVVVVALTFVVAARDFVRLEQRMAELDADARDDQELLASALAPTVARTWRIEGRAAASYTLEYARQFYKRRRVRLVGLDGAAAARDRPTVAPAELRLSHEHPVRSRVVVGSTGERTLLTYAWLALDVDGEAPHAIELSTSLVARSTLLRRALPQALAALAVFLAMAAVLVFVIGGWLVGRPLNRLVEHTERLGSGDLRARVTVSQRDELGTLAAAMNRMGERLADADAKAQRETEGRILALRQLRHSERLATVGKLAAGLAHEVGTPLNVIRGRAGFIEQSKRVDAQDREHAGVIVQQVDRIAKTLRGLLDFARGGAVAQAPEREEIDVGELVEQTVDLLRVAAKKKRIALRSEQRGRAVRARADRSQLEQVLTNLIVNAIDASPTGAEVEVGCSLDGEHDPDVQLWVNDHGSGIAEQDMEHLFEPFFTTKGQGEGTGLGLAIVYGIVREHGGQIEVESRAGAGSRFTVVLPARGRSSQAPPLQAHG